MYIGQGRKLRDLVTLNEMVDKVYHGNGGFGNLKMDCSDLHEIMVDEIYHGNGGFGNFKMAAIWPKIIWWIKYIMVMVDLVTLK